MPQKKTTAKKPAAKKPATKPTTKKSAPKKLTAKQVVANKAAAYSGKLVSFLRKPTVVVVLLVIAVSVVVLLAANRDAKQPTKSPEAYQQELQAQVENSDGTPANGRDPASQGQNSLAAAASKPSGAGQRTDSPASGATGGGSHASHGDVYGDAQGSGINSAGCFIDYGVQGQQCLPAHAAGDDKVLNCAEVRKYFKDGIKVTGTDRFHLDHDGDKIACGPGEHSH